MMRWAVSVVETISGNHSRGKAIDNCAKMPGRTDPGKFKDMLSIIDNYVKELETRWLRKLNMGKVITICSVVMYFFHQRYFWY